MPTVLLVDDDDAVRAAVGDWLEAAGFHVIAAPDTMTGLRELEAHADIDICVADLVMPPAMPDGAAFLQLLGSKRPDLPVILMTGYYSAAERILDRKTTLFYKPFDLDTLGNEIRRLLAP